jgi:hypothetical protein
MVILDASFRAVQLCTTSVGCIKWMSGLCQALFSTRPGRRAMPRFCLRKQKLSSAARQKLRMTGGRSEKDLDKNGASY